MKNKNRSVRDLCLIGIFTALICILSLISIPMPYGIPITLQTFAVPLAGIILGPRRGAVSTVIYILIGTIGVPVFSGFSAGPGAIFGVTGGFILAFPLLALFSGWGAQKDDTVRLICGLTLGLFLDYTAGVLQFTLVSGSNFQTGLLTCVIPFIPMDAAKLVFAGVIGIKSKSALLQNGLL